MLFGLIIYYISLIFVKDFSNFYKDIKRMETKLERVLTGSHKEEMISYLSAHPEDFEEAIKLAIADKQPYSWRAAWVLWSCVEENDIKLRNKVKDIIDVLPDRKDNQQRELLKILQMMEIDEEHEGLLFELCVTLWKDISNQASVRYNAFKLLVKFAQKYPELSSEISFLTGSQYVNSLSAGVKRCVSKMMKGIR